MCQSLRVQAEISSVQKKHCKKGIITKSPDSMGWIGGNSTAVGILMKELVLSNNPKNSGGIVAPVITIQNGKSLFNLILTSESFQKLLEAAVRVVFWIEEYQLQQRR